MNSKIYGLKGFLGFPSDWEYIRQTIGYSFEVLDPTVLASPEEGLAPLGRALNRWVRDQPKQKRFLLGYSQGGRLAMHALVDEPSLWSGAIIISAHTGLQSVEEKSQRLEADRKWADRFLNDPWKEVISDWDRQAVFQGVRAFHRREENYERALLAKMMTGWSLGKQEDLQEALCKLPLPILWIAGEKDLRYVQVAERMAHLHPYSSCWIAPGIGHRVPWECPDLLLEQVRVFTDAQRSAKLF